MFPLDQQLPPIAAGTSQYFPLGWKGKSLFPKASLYWLLAVWLIFPLHLVDDPNWQKLLSEQTNKYRVSWPSTVWFGVKSSRKVRGSRYITFSSLNVWNKYLQFGNVHECIKFVSAHSSIKIPNQEHLGILNDRFRNDGSTHWIPTIGRQVRTEDPRHGGSDGKLLRCWELFEKIGQIS